LATGQIETRTRLGNRSTSSVKAARHRAKGGAASANQRLSAPERACHVQSPHHSNSGVHA